MDLSYTTSDIEWEPMRVWLDSFKHSPRPFAMLTNTGCKLMFSFRNIISCMIWMEAFILLRNKMKQNTTKQSEWKLTPASSDFLSLSLSLSLSHYACQSCRGIILSNNILGDITWLYYVFYCVFELISTCAEEQLSLIENWKKSCSRCKKYMTSDRQYVYFAFFIFSFFAMLWHKNIIHFWTKY